MARFVFPVLVVFLFIQLTASQTASDACIDALNTLSDNSEICSDYIVNDPDTFCTGNCRTYNENVIKYCAAEVCNCIRR